MRKSRKVLALMAMVAITASALAGCGSGTATSAGSSATTGGSSAAATELSLIHIFFLDRLDLVAGSGLGVPQLCRSFCQIP